MAKTSKKVSARGTGFTVKLRYLGDSEEILSFTGAATRSEYKVGGRINLVDVDSRDLSTGVSWAPGLLELTGPGGKLFDIHTPRKRKTKPAADEVTDGEGAVSGD